MFNHFFTSLERRANRYRFLSPTAAKETIKSLAIWLVAPRMAMRLFCISLMNILDVAHRVCRRRQAEGGTLLLLPSLFQSAAAMCSQLFSQKQTARIPCHLPGLLASRKLQQVWRTTGSCIPFGWIDCVRQNTCPENF